MVDQRKALSDTTELTDTVYFLHPTGIRILNLWYNKRHCNTLDEAKEDGWTSTYKKLRKYRIYDMATDGCV